MRKISNSPRVHESDYISAEFGPPQDTDTFDKQTPVATNRPQKPLPPRVSSTPSRPGWIERSQEIARPQTSNHLVFPQRTLQIAGTIGGLGIVVAVFIGVYLLASQITEPTAAAETHETTTRTQEWEGVQVKKALK